MKYILILLFLFSTITSAEDDIKVKKDLNGTSLKCEYGEEQIIKTKNGEVIDEKIVPKNNPNDKSSTYPLFFLYFDSEKLYLIDLPYSDITLVKRNLGKYKQNIYDISVFFGDKTIKIDRKDLSFIQIYSSTNPNTEINFRKIIKAKCQKLSGYKIIEKYFLEEINKRKKIIKENNI